MLFTINYGQFIWKRRRQWHPTPVFLPGKSHGWRSLEGCSLWGREELDMTKRLHFHFSLSCIGEGNGNPLQCSCLENPRDGGAWWTAIYGVAQSRTWLKWLSSSSSIWKHSVRYTTYFYVRCYYRFSRNNLIYIYICRGIRVYLIVFDSQISQDKRFLLTPLCVRVYSL